MVLNSNMIYGKNITSEEFLPRIKKGENLFVAIHPDYQHNN